MTRAGKAVDLELVELVDTEHWDDITKTSIVKVNCIRINGQEVLVPRNTSIEFMPVATDGTATVEVRLSLFVRSLHLGYERREDAQFTGDPDAVRALLETGCVINAPTCDRGGVDLRPRQAVEDESAS